MEGRAPLDARFAHGEGEYGRRDAKGQQRAPIAQALADGNLAWHLLFELLFLRHLTGLEVHRLYLAWRQMDHLARAVARKGPRVSAGGRGRRTGARRAAPGIVRMHRRPTGALSQLSHALPYLLLSSQPSAISHQPATLAGS